MIKLLKDFPELKPYRGDIELRVFNYEKKKKELLKNAKGRGLVDFANGHKYFGFHHDREAGRWIYREWAPAADQVYLTGDFNDWRWTEDPLEKIDDRAGIWEIRLPEDMLYDGSRVRTIVKNGEELTEHLPLYARRCVQNEATKMWHCEVWDPQESFPWTDGDFAKKFNGGVSEAPYIYEAHVGMATEEWRPGSYREFADNVLPRIKHLGYNTVQLMAVMEHPYYGSFGYQVSNFYAASSRFGYPEEFKYLVNRAHQLGLRVLLDLVHSHAVKNVLEGINRFDGTDYQFFHEGAKGDHGAWGTKCFDYGKNEVIHYLLSNLKFWLEEFHLDGFRFDGVTSMLYHDHGLGSNFTDLGMYFTMNTDTEAVTYLQLANQLVHELKAGAITIAEDMSGMPGMCSPVKDGGIGFDYRLGMGLPDHWIKLMKEYKDEDWDLGQLWYQLTNRNAATVAYVESHDQALVGDQTMMFRLAGPAIYTEMSKDSKSQIVDRAMAIHKMARIITAGAGGTGYLNFMGNEFGHPEWIDFPREGNGWSMKYCRRQWSLVDDHGLKYEWLNNFDRDMIRTLRYYGIMRQTYPELKLIHEDDRVIAFERAGLLFVFNFHTWKSYWDYLIPVSGDEDYQALFSSDDWEYGGKGRVNRDTISPSFQAGLGDTIAMSLPPRTVTVLKPVSL